MSLDLERGHHSNRLVRTALPGINSSYDAVVVLGAGVWKPQFRENNTNYKAHERYLPTDFRHKDEFGILGGAVRLLATKELVRMQSIPVVVFTGGVSEKIKAKFGPNVPAEAVVYESRYSRLVEMSNKQGELIPAHTTITEVQAVNTVGNLREGSRIIGKNQWGNVALITSDYHAPRTTILWRYVPEETGQIVTIDVIGAETYLKTIYPGKYDSAIDHWYGSPAALQRLRNEEQGLRDLANDQYFPSEFQIAK